MVDIALELFVVRLLLLQYSSSLHQLGQVGLETRMFY